VHKAKEKRGDYIAACSSAGLGLLKPTEPQQRFHATHNTTSQRDVTWSRTCTAARTSWRWWL